MGTELRDFLEIPYDQLEELNLEAKAQRLARKSPEAIQEERLRYLADEKRIKAVTVVFADLEGRLHMLDYDKKFLLKSADNLTFDGSSIRGFSRQQESDLRLAIDWPAFYWLPSDIFGPGKVLVFGEVRGRDAERTYHETGRFEFISTGGYYHSLPGDALRQFIDTAAEVQRAMGFANEKDHPEVAPSQFEMNYSYTEASVAADQVQLYKLLSRQVAAAGGRRGFFLPKPMTGVNGSGMHTNLSVPRQSTNLFYEKDGKDGLSAAGWDFISRILASATDICLVLNSSVNSYRRLDPHFEAPNQIKASAIDRGSMVRIPLGNERSARVEVRSIAPDANPYLAIYTLLKTGLEGPQSEEDGDKRPRTRFLPDNIYDAIRLFKGSRFMQEVMGEEVHAKFAEIKLAQAERCPKALGTLIKASEVQFHHEVTNQFLWSQF